MQNIKINTPNALKRNWKENRKRLQKKVKQNKLINKYKGDTTEKGIKKFSKINFFKKKNLLLCSFTPKL